MRVGVTTPVLSLLPRAHARWEEDAGLPEVVEIARALDRLGYHHLTCSEHVAIPAPVAAVRGGRYWDPLATLGYLAAHTERIRLATHVLVLGYHHPLELAKRYGTLDRVCGGRLILGVGVGSLREEFDLLRVEFEGRGERADEAILAAEPPLDPGGDATRTREAVARLKDAGATMLNLRFVHHSPAHFVEQAEAMLALAE